MEDALPDLPTDVYYLICGHLAATDLLAFSRCCRRSRAAALCSIRVVAVASFDGAAVEVYLNPRSPPGWTTGGIDLSELCYRPATDRRVVAAARGPAHAVSLTHWLRVASPRRLLLQRQPVGGRVPPADPLSPFFDALAIGLRGLSLDGVAVDGAAAAAFGPAVRFPSALRSLCLSELDFSQPVAAVPAVAAALAADGSSLHSLWLWFVAHAWDASAICPVVTSYLAFPLPGLRSLGLCCRVDRTVTAVIARFDALETLRLVGHVEEGALQELALPRLPRLHHLDVGYGLFLDIAAEAAAVHGRSLGYLALTTDWVVANAKNEVLLATRHLPEVLMLRGQAPHDVRPLCGHGGRRTLHSLAFSLGPTADVMLGAVAFGLGELRELTLFVAADAHVDGLHAWPAGLRVARLVLRVAKENGVTVNDLVSVLAGASAAVTHLCTLVVESRARLTESTLRSVSRLARLQRLHLKLCMAAALPAERQREVEREAFASIPGRVSVEWADGCLDP